MRVNEEVRKCVCFICVPKASFNIDRAVTLVGTGFFASVESKQDPEISYVYLVTAKHLAEKLVDKTFLVRMNTKMGSYDYLKGDGNLWLYHPTEESVDVAVIPCAPDQAKYDYKMVSVNTFLKDEILEQKKQDRKDLLQDLFNELGVIKSNLTGKGKLHFPDIWESAISSGQIRLLESEHVRKLASIYHDVKGMEYEAIRCRDLAEEIRLAKAKGQDKHLDDLTLLWSRFSAILRDREKRLLIKIDEILKEEMWTMV